MGIGHNPSPLTAQDVFDLGVYLIDIEGSIGKLLREHLLFFDHFEAITIADLPNEYTETAFGGGTIAIYLDENPSIVQLASGAVNGDGYTIESDRTVSLLRFGEGLTTLICELRLRISTEANITMNFGFWNITTNDDRVAVSFNTAGAPPQNDGAIQSGVDGAMFYTDANLASGLDLTEYHVYRIEFDPEDEIRLYVDDQLRATENDPGEVSPDNSWRLFCTLLARAAANVTLDLDYWRVWAE